MPLPNPNPMVTLEMPLDAFNKVQGILAKRPFEEVADLVINFRQQIGVQVERIAAEQQAEAGLKPGAPGGSGAPTRLHAIAEAEPAG